MRFVLVVFCFAYEEIALGFLQEFVGKPYADLEDKLMQMLPEIKSRYLNLKPLTEYVVNYMQNLYQGFNSHGQCDYSYSHLTVGYFNINKKLTELDRFLNPANLTRMWGLAKFCGG